MLVARRASRVLVALTAGAAVLATPAPVTAEPFPEVIELPTGWLPEGIASGPGPTVYSGSRATRRRRNHPPLGRLRARGRDQPQRHRRLT